MINKTYDEKIAAWLAENRQVILDKWMELVRIPSVKGPAQPNAPFGRACAQALRTAAHNLEELGLQVKLNEEEGYAVAECGAGEKCIGLFGHSDVVPAGDGWLLTEPFEPVLRDGWLIGRGVTDNKSGVMASWCLAAMLQQLKLPMKNRLQIFVGSNEESGMQDIKAYVRNERQPELCLVPDSSYPCALGEKGILRMWARCSTPMEAVQACTGGNAFNIVLDRVEAVITNQALASQLQEKCREDSGDTVIPQADGTRTVTVNGIAKHAAYPDDSLNATWRLAKLLLECDALPEGDRKCLETVAAYLEGYWGEGLKIAHEDPDFGRLTCVNGMVKMEDGHLLVSLDIRYGVACDPKSLEQRLCAMWEQAGWQITYLENRPGYSADPKSPYPAVLKAVSEGMTGREMHFYRMAGGTYGRYLKTAFPVGTAAAHADRSPVALNLPAGHGGVHQRDEAIDPESFFLGVRVLAQAVLACDSLL